MKKYIDGFKYGLGIATSLVVIVFFVLWGVKARNGPDLISSDVGDKLTASKYNALVNTAYHSSASKITSSDFATSSTTFVSDASSNVSLNVKNNDLILVTMDGKVNPNPTAQAVYIKLVLVSGPGSFISNSTKQLYAQGLSWSPVSSIYLLKATADGTLTFAYQGQCSASATCTYRNVEINAVVIGKYQ